MTHLKVSDIDSKRMVIHVQGGKGRKGRDVMVEPKTTRRGAARALARITAQAQRLVLSFTIGPPRTKPPRNR